MNRRIALALAVATAAAVMATGCSRSSTGPDPESIDPLGYKPRTSPGNVLYNLEKAYENMDAEAYLDCLAEGYILFLNPYDAGGDPGLPEYWSKNEERVIHWNMFGDDTDVQEVSLAFTHLSYDFEEGDWADPFDDIWTYTEAVHLRVRVPLDLTLLADEPAEFQFSVDPDSTGTNGETLWEISKQWDYGTGGRCSRERRETSWVGIKSMYL
jgi:hypothetical protein